MPDSPLRRRPGLSFGYRKQARAGGTGGPTVVWPATYVPVDTSGIESSPFKSALDYRYLLFETLSGNFIDELPVTYCSYGKVLNGPGGGEIHLPIRAMKGSWAEALDRPFEEKVTSNSFEEYTHSIAIERNGVCVWSGFIGRTRVSSADRRVNIALIGYWDYFRNRLMRAPVDYSASPTDVFTVVRSLLDYCQDEYGDASDIDVVTGSGLAGITTDLKVNSYDFRYYGDVVEDLAKSDNRFDFEVVTQFDIDHNLFKFLKLGYPKLGRRVEFVAEWGKNITVYNYERDGDARKISIWGIGAGEGDNLVLARSIDNTALGRTPIRDGTITRKALDSTQQGTLQNLTDGEIRKYGGSVQILSATLGDAFDAVGAFSPGDSIQAKVDDGFAQVDSWMKVLTTTVRVQDNMSESMDIDLGPEWATGG